MRIITNAVSEQEILLPTRTAANHEQIHEAIVTRAEYCVDHLCGCNR
jgi:hypothetical protein